MFENQNNLKDQTQEKKENSQNQEAKKDLPKVSDTKIHTMPEKFLQTGQTKYSTKTKTPSSLKKNILIGGLICIVIIAFIVLGFWFLLQSLEQEPENQLADLQTQSQNQPETNNFQNTQEEEDLCSEDACDQCSFDQCSNLSEFCHLEDLCQPSDSIENCPNYVCLFGPEEIDLDNLDQEEPELILAQDDDFDLLTNVEEDLWQSDPNNSDTDGDSYSDSEEILNLYNPNQAGSAKLFETDLIKKYIDNIYSYSIYYPSSWQENKIDDQTMFISETGEFVQIIIQEQENDCWH